jgi:hypothetical protein
MLQMSVARVTGRLAQYRVVLSTLAKSILDTRSRLDLLLLSSLVFAATSLAIWAQIQFPDALYSHDFNDVWFDADPPRVAENLLAFNTDHQRTSVHPIFSLAVYPIVKVLKSFGLDPLLVMKGMVVCLSGLTVATIYIGLRALTNSAVAAALFSAVFVASATHIYWFSLVETYSFAALSIAVMLVVMTRPYPLPESAWIFASAFTLAITVTNWMLGLAATFFCQPFRRFLRISLITLATVMVLALIQLAIFPTAKLFFLPNSMLGETKYTSVARPDWTPIPSVRSFFLTSAVAPPSVKVRLDGAVILSNQHVSFGQMGPAGWIALTSWISLLLFACWAVCRQSTHPNVARAILAFLAGQMALHLVYGDITFLYAGNFFPALVCFAAFGFFTPYRWLVYVSAIVFILFGGFNNIQQFSKSIASAREIVQACQTNRKGPCADGKSLF